MHSENSPHFWSIGERPAAGDYVVLLHGLGRTRFSMARAARLLNKAGFHTVNIGYPSRKKTVEEAVAEDVAPAVAKYCMDARKKIHFLTHSLGGIVLRVLLREAPPLWLGRVVMLSPPNQGSDIAEHLHDSRFLRTILGPAFDQLGTGPEGLAARLGPVPAETGVIMGSWALIPIFKALLGPHSDGIVAVERGRLPGLAAFTILPVDHSTMMRNRAVIAQSEGFFRSGRFH